MTIQQLEYIVALDNHRHFVTAANSLYVTQPTLTMQVKKLEEEVGIKIFDRDRKPLKPTPAGEQIIQMARQVLREVDQMKAFVSSETESLEGNFTLGIIPTLAPYLLPLFLPEFIRENPRIHLKIQEIQTQEIISRLNNGTLDLGLLVTPLENKTIREVPLFYEPFLLYLPENHPLANAHDLTSNRLDPDDMLFLEEGHCFREQALKICYRRDKKKDLGFEYASGSIETLKKLVRQGIGYTLVPELSVVTELDSRNIKRFNSPEPVREVSLVVHNNFTREALIERLHSTIISAIPERFKRSELFTRVKWR
jgi:LysR family hydrogen peroxide-inducible transcriptional activator